MTLSAESGIESSYRVVSLISPEIFRSPKEHGILVNAISPVAKTRMWNVQDEPEDLRPEQVAPGVLYLASDGCRESGFILRASNGQFRAVRPIERDNVNYPFNLAAVESSTAEDLATRWQEIAADVAF